MLARRFHVGMALLFLLGFFAVDTVSGGDIVVAPHPLGLGAVFPVDLEPERPNALQLFVQDSRVVLSSPLRWESRDWKKAGLMSGVTLGFFLLDEDIQERVQSGREDYWEPSWEAKPSDRVSEWVKPLGDRETALALMGSFYLVGRLGHDDRARRTGIEGLEALVMTSAIVEAVKHAVDRERPCGAGIDSEIGPPCTAHPGRSFPSGHAATAFSMAAVIASEYRHRRAVPIVAYGLASLVAYSRVNENRHWASDVFAGAAIGFFVAKAVVGRHDERRVRMAPTFSRNGAMLTIHVRF